MIQKAVSSAFSRSCTFETKSQLKMLRSFWKSGLVVALLALGLVGVCGGDDKSDLEARVEQLETQIKALLTGALRT